jgi:hypothetical protein
MSYLKNTFLTRILRSEKICNQMNVGLFMNYFKYLINDAVIEDFTNSVSLKSLKVLDISKNLKVSDEAMNILSKAKKTSLIVTINISNTIISDTGLRKLVLSPFISNLRNIVVD